MVDRYLCDWRCIRWLSSQAPETSTAGTGLLGNRDTAGKKQLTGKEEESCTSDFLKSSG
jgi:hypothetical protein